VIKYDTESKKITSKYVALERRNEKKDYSKEFIVFSKDDKSLVAYWEDYDKTGDKKRVLYASISTDDLLNSEVKELSYAIRDQYLDSYNLKLKDPKFLQIVSNNSGNTSGVIVGNPQTNGNAALASTVIPTFNCPSDSSAGPTDRLSGVYYSPGGNFKGAATNYDFITSDSDYYRCNNWGTSGALKRMFGENSTTRPGDVIDGLSNTFALGETTKYHSNGAAFAWSYRAHVMTGVDPGTSNPGINLWHLPSVDPTWQNPPYTPVNGRIRTWWAAAGSMHSGGSHFAFGDGSVRFMTENTSGVTLEALSTMAGGEVISLP